MDDIIMDDIMEPLLSEPFGYPDFCDDPLLSLESTDEKLFADSPLAIITIMVYIIWWCK